MAHSLHVRIPPHKADFVCQMCYNSAIVREPPVFMDGYMARGHKNGAGICAFCYYSVSMVCRSVEEVNYLCDRHSLQYASMYGTLAYKIWLIRQWLTKDIAGCITARTMEIFFRSSER
jgi:hypothetical protein